ncbi:MAG: hypothetical protein DRQ55_02435 [Planctomycetota bacterium]|nr:MAG: hypothetical protein DRQ55_02435 [Planctomycetota bacterium]
MHQLLTEMPPERLGQIYEALPEPVQRALDTPIGQALNSRPGSVSRRPLALRVKALRSWLTRKRDDGLAGDLLRAYLLGPRKELVAAFLDSTGLEHEDGQLTDDEAKPDEAKIASTVATLTEAYEPDDVRLYLEIAVLQWPDSEALGEALTQLRPSS